MEIKVCEYMPKSVKDAEGKERELVGIMTTGWLMVDTLDPDFFEKNRIVLLLGDECKR